MTQGALFQQGSHGIERAVERRDAGIAQAAETAGEAWCDAAYDAFTSWLKGRDEAFCDDFHRDTNGAWCRKAFGVVVKRAARAGLIERVGYRPSVQSHLSPKPLWRVVR